MEPPPAPLVRAYLFLSFDLVNSTIFKQHHSEKWPTETGEFYRSAEQGLTARISKASVWKYAGDEVLFYRSAHSKDDVTTWVTSGYEVLQLLDEQMRSRSEGQLRVKGTCWVALASTEAAPNLVFSHTAEAGAPTRDFLGPEIDAGFRLGGTTCQGTLALSAELAAFLLVHAPNPVTEKVRLVSFKKLKGVWKNRHYPICWYRNDLSTGFDYDDKYENPLLGEALQGGEEKKQVVQIVEKVKPHYVDDLVAALAKPEPEIVTPPKFEVHCAAVVQKSDGSVLVAKRSDSKRTYPGKWEFGCAQLQLGDSFESAVMRDYKEDFGLKVTFDVPTSVLGTYSFVRDGRHVPGVVVLAKTSNPSDLAKLKHAKVQWIDPGDPPNDVVANAVPDLAEILKKIRARPSPKTSRAPRSA